MTVILIFDALSYYFFHFNYITTFIFIIYNPFNINLSACTESAQKIIKFIINNKSQVISVFLSFRSLSTVQ